MVKHTRRNFRNLLRLLAKKSPLGPLLLKKFRSRPHQEALQIGREKGWESAASWMLKDTGQSVLSDPSFHNMLRCKINYDIETEFLMVQLRKKLLLKTCSDSFKDSHIIEILVSLIVQAHNNEFVWQVTEEEKKFLRECETQIIERQFSKSKNRPLPLLLLLYQRAGQGVVSFNLHQEELAKLKLLTLDHRQEIDKLLNEVSALQAQSKTIEWNGKISKESSKQIACLYENYPYPRWLHWGINKPGSRISTLHQFFTNDELAFTKKPFTVLVAGCGTGSKAIAYAIEYGDNVHVVAIDFSRASLAYAKHMAKQHKVDNIEFIQMDLYDLHRWEGRFDIVECTGVLHHLPDPVKGGRALVASAKDSAIIHISVYSTKARSSLAYLRDKYNLTPKCSSNEIRYARMKIMQEDNEIIDNKMCLRDNFFDLNQCKDLLFHPLERTYTLSEVEVFLHEIELEFRGLERPDIIENQYWTRFPNQKDIGKIDAWNDFETNNPMAFSGLYEIWLKKSSEQQPKLES